MFCSCWDDDDDETFLRKRGVFVASESLQQEEEHSRGYVPWVWSRKIEHTYHLGKLLGRGAYAIVHEATQVLPPHQSYAIKIMQRHQMSQVDKRHFHDEIHILLDLQHENIIQLHELYKTNDFFYLVMEKLDGGELFERLCEKTFYSEMNARNMCRTVFDAISYCHSRRIVHRDLKPENLLLCSQHNDDHVKIADFGFSKKVPRPKSLRTQCGSSLYLAPEIINFKAYDERVDCWSLGVIVFTILGGYSPFQANTNHLIFQRIRQADYSFPSQWWNRISPDAKNFISRLLTRDFDKRMTVDQALQHPWMTGRGDDLKNHSVNLEGLKKFRTAERERNSSARSVSMYWIVSRR